MISLKEISGDKKRLFLLGIITMLVFLSWSGVLDRLSYDYLDSSFTSAAATYVVARAINATVSIIQTTEVSIGFASLQIGQMVDPINDMVERFSDLIVIAIGSIITQKILLSIVSSIFFKALLTISGLALIASIYIKETPFIKVLSQLFIFLVFLRLVLSMMVLLNFTVDKSFLDEKINYNHAQLQSLSDELDEMQRDKADTETRNTLLEAGIQSFQHQKESLNSELEIQMSELQELRENVKNTEKSIDQVESNLDFVDSINPLHQDDTLEAMKNKQSEEEMLVTKKEAYIEKINTNLEDIDDKIIYSRNVITGESNGVMDSISNSFSGMTESFESIDVSEMKEKLDNKVGSLLDLLILYTMKTLILPILFMYLLLKAFRLIWGIDLAAFIKREYTTLKPTDPPATIESK